jgi:hypothetical protein
MDFDEPIYTVAEIAEKLKLDTDTVRRLFNREPGVLVICFPTAGKRTYRTLRIPASVFTRVLTRLAHVDDAHARVKGRWRRGQ